MIISPPKPSKTPARGKLPTTSSQKDSRQPYYDCHDREAEVQVIVYLPDVDESSVEITTRGPDLLVTGRKQRYIRVNFEALKLESAQHDYQLSLRLGHSVDFSSLQAEIHEGVLTILLPKKQTAPFAVRTGLTRVA